MVLYYILKLLGAALIRGQLKLEGGAYFKVRDMNKIKCQNLVIFSFKTRISHKFLLWLKRNFIPFGYELNHNRHL